MPLQRQRHEARRPVRAERRGGSVLARAKRCSPAWGRARRDRRPPRRGRARTGQGLRRRWSASSATTPREIRAPSRCERLRPRLAASSDAAEAQGRDSRSARPARGPAHREPTCREHPRRPASSYRTPSAAALADAQGVERCPLVCCAPIFPAITVRARRRLSSTSDTGEPGEPFMRAAASRARLRGGSAMEAMGFATKSSAPRSKQRTRSISSAAAREGTSSGRRAS